jgi:hypothetical protein
MDSFERFVNVLDLHCRRLPVPLRVTHRYSLQGDVEVRVYARDENGSGYGAVLLNGLALLTAPRAFEKRLVETIRKAADGALTAYLLDHETRQGWPPRDCLHDHVEGAEVAA